MTRRLAPVRQLLGTVAMLLGLFTLLASALDDEVFVDRNHDSDYEPKQQNILIPFRSHHPSSPSSKDSAYDAPLQFSPAAATNTLQELLNALAMMQNEYFSLWLGKWTSAIDWTAAVAGTYVSATLHSLSHSLSYTMSGTFDKECKLDVEAQMVENEINKYFAQSTTYYFGEEYFSLRTQANDDMLWVVLGWLESVQFIGSHFDRHYPPSSKSARSESEWHGTQFVPAFAHRARVFYELASKGWDWRLCGGGMTWNPHLLPYKNAITNQLFISASVAMYLHFPGDDNCSPFAASSDGDTKPNWKAYRAHEEPGVVKAYENTNLSSTYDPIYLANAVNGYDWLKNSGMQNSLGLYVDGFHIGGYATNHSKTQCNERNEMVYTYNQGVVLSGLRGLWEATGNLTYLEDGHELVRDVILATGWTDTDILSAVSFFDSPPKKRRASSKKASSNAWSGLGSSGILTELCDPSGLCSQDGQTFKGIFFHHFVSFCTPLPESAVQPGKTHAAPKVIASLHHSSCTMYVPWVVHNARAAGETRDSRGRFGMWWGADVQGSQEQEMKEGKKGDQQNKKKAGEKGQKQKKKLNTSTSPPLPTGAIDYRNNASRLSFLFSSDPDSQALSDQDTAVPIANTDAVLGIQESGDPNDRGRGRTVETQGGGVAVTRAMWEFLRRYEDDNPE